MDSRSPLEPFFSGAASALLVVAAYTVAVGTGVGLGAWSAGWDVHGPEACMMEYFATFLGLRKLMGLVCFVGLGVTTLVYFKVACARWEALNLLALLGTVYMYVAMGCGDAPHTQTIIIRVPGWRIGASVAGIVTAYALGRAALAVRGARISWEARRPA